MSSTPNTPAVPEVVKNYPVIEDDGPYASFLDSNRFAHMQRLGGMFAASTLVPQHLQGKTADCTILVEMAMRLNQNPLAFLQKCYIVHGKPGMEAQLVIALMNTSGLFKDPIDYEVEGDDPKDAKYRVRAFAVRKSTGKTLYGPWVDWPTVKAEGWLDKGGSKWKTMPALMFMYRAAAWFSRAHCPEATMGMAMVEELRDMEPDAPAPRKDVTPERTKELAADLAKFKTVSTATVIEGTADATPEPVRVGKPEPEPEPTKEATPEPEPTKPETEKQVEKSGMNPEEELIIKMSEVYGIDLEQAELALEAHCKKTLEKSLTDASYSKMNTKMLKEQINTKKIPTV